MQPIYESQRYLCTRETLRDTVSKYGVGIIANVLDENECQNMVDGIWQFLEHITSEWDIPLNRNDTDTWREFYKLSPSHSMLLQHWGVGHIQASWDVRQNPKIVEIFAYFWNCTPEELLVSFDGLSFNLPPEITKKGWHKNMWYHTDQSYTRPTFECIQSWITGIDVNENDATLSFIEGSNKFHREFQEKFNISNKKDWYKLNKDEEQFYTENGCSYKNIKCPKGSLVVWDSRTIHCGINASKNRTVPNMRSVIYLCYMPRSMCNESNLKKKRKAFCELRATSHYPCNIKLFSKTPHTYGAPIPIIKPIESPVLNDLGKKLAGF